MRGNHVQFRIQVKRFIPLGLNLKKDRDKFKYVTNHNYESSLSGLYILGPLTGNDQAIIAAGEGASAAIDMKKRLLEL